MHRLYAKVKTFDFMMMVLILTYHLTPNVTMVSSHASSIG